MVIFVVMNTATTDSKALGKDNVVISSLAAAPAAIFTVLATPVALKADSS